jgi:hypothetical protein
MILLQDLEDYVVTIKDRVAAINFTATVLDGTEVNRRVKDLNGENNTLLFLLIPEVNGSGSRENNYRGGTTMDIYLLNKTDYKEGQDEYIQVFKDTQPVAIEVAKLIFNDAQSGCHPLLQHIDFTKYNITPAAAMAGCNGWFIQFEIKSWL